MKANLLKIKEIVNKINEKFQIKSKQEIIRQITNEIRAELPDNINSCILEVTNCSIEEPSFRMEVLVNGELRFELDEDSFALDMFADVVALNVLSNQEVLDLYESLLNLDWITEDEVDDYRYNFIAYLDEKNVTFFMGGEDDHTMEFDMLDNLKSLNGFSEGIVFSVEEEE
jgi:hypothetical protein